MLNQLNLMRREINAHYNKIRREANRVLTEEINEERKRELAQETADGEKDSNELLEVD